MKSSAFFEENLTELSSCSGFFNQGIDWGDLPPKTCESNFFHHDFEQFGKQHSRFKAILP